MVAELNVYLQAAQLLSTYGFSCLAIQAATCRSFQPYRDVPEVKSYVAMFSHTGNMDDFTVDVNELDAGRKEWRLTALCFAAAMYDTGDL